MSELKTVAGADALEPGEAGVFEVDGREVALFNIDGTLHALENTCCHRGGPLGEGTVEGHTVTCPWHMWRFDVRDGACANSPGDFVRTYEVVIQAGEVKIRL